jgi:ATP phosphoribosyltransferase
VRIGIACEAGPPPAELLDLLEAAGLPAASLREETPPALLPAPGGVWLLASSADVLRACDRGGIDLGVVGRDRLLEGRRGTGELLDLRRCRDELVFAAGPGEPRPGRRLRVATRHPETARGHFAASGRQPVILAMDEPVLAPVLGLADGVVELTSRLAAESPGASTLEVREVVAVCSARLVAARASRVLLRDEIGALVDRLRAVRDDA